MITKELRNKVYESGNPAQKHLYADGDSGNKMMAIAAKYDLHKDKEMYTKYALTIGDIILGFYRIQDTVPLLQQELGIDPRTAALLGADVLDFLTPLSDPTWQPPIDPDDVITEVPKSTLASPTPSLPTEPYNQILQGLGNLPVAPTQNWTAPAAPTPASTNNPLHFEPVHTATGQDAIRQPLSQIPSYNSQPPKSSPDTNIEPPPQWGRY